MKRLGKLLLVIAVCLYPFSLNKTEKVKANWSRSLVQSCVQKTTVLFGEAATHKWLGSGVLISRNGLVLTAAHVVDASDLRTLTMVTLNGNLYEMKVLLVNKRLDLALVEPKASAQDFPFAKVQVSNDLWTGEPVLIVGHPLQHFFTVTDGIITSLPFSFAYFNRIIETNALILPGNSGGPVFNEKGEVIGIVSAMYVQGLLGPTGIGIVVPIDGIHHLLKAYTYLPRSTQVKRYKIGEIK